MTENEATERAERIGRGLPVERLPGDPKPEGAELLDELSAHIRRYVVLGAHQLTAVTLWVAHCHAIETAWTTGRLNVRSPVEECGKSLLFDVLESVVPDALADVSISPAALYRSLDETRPPTILLDEIDNTIARSGAADSESLSLLVAVLNAGYRRGKTVRRCVGKGHEVKKFPTFAPAAFAGIDTAKLNRALRSRCIPIEMQRRTPDELIDEYLAWEAVPAGEALRDRLAAWARSHVEELRETRPERPAAIRDRLAECWLPLFAIADAAGADWPARARAAAIKLHGLDREQDETGLSLGARLLAAVRDVFGDREALWTAELLAELNADEEAPWSRWNDGGGINARDLARQLQRFGVHRSADIWLDGTTRKGYRREWFEDSWARYCRTRGSGTLGGEEHTAATDSGDSRPLGEIEGRGLQPLSRNGSSDLADKAGGYGEPDPPPPQDDLPPDEDDALNETVELLEDRLGATICDAREVES